MDEVNFVFPSCEKIPLSVETSERFLLVDGSGKRVVRLTFDAGEHQEIKGISGSCSNSMANQ